jgi:hypothetical protein
MPNMPEISPENRSAKPQRGGFLPINGGFLNDSKFVSGKHSRREKTGIDAKPTTTRHGVAGLARAERDDLEPLEKR